MSAAYIHRPVVLVPEHQVELAEITDWAAKRYAGHPRLEVWLRVMARTTVETRYYLRPVEAVLADEPLPEREAATSTALLALAVEASRQALGEAGLAASEVTDLVVSSAAWVLPGLDVALIGALGLAPTTRTVSATQYGCAGGVWGLAVASERVEASGGVALVLAADPQSIHQPPAEPTSGSMVWQALIGDAVSATVITATPPAAGGRVVEAGPEWEYVLPDTRHLVGARLEDGRRPGAGVGITLWSDPALPRSVNRVMPPLLDWLENTADPGTAPIPPWCSTHTGGPRILDALRVGLSLPEAELDTARDQLARFGNVAGAASLSVLAERMTRPPAPGTPGLVLAVGPGFRAVALRVTVR